MLHANKSAGRTYCPWMSPQTVDRVSDATQRAIDLNNVLVTGLLTSSRFGSCRSIAVACSRIYIACVSVRRPSRIKCDCRNAGFGIDGLLARKNCASDGVFFSGSGT